MAEDRYEIDASQFQKQLGELATTIALKIQREGVKSVPRMVVEDLYVLVRHAQRTYDLIFYLNADERRENDCYWHAYYGVAVLPVVRSMIDCLYNITAILTDPVKKAAEYRRSGYRMALEALQDDEVRYQSRSEQNWRDWLERRRRNLDFSLRRDGFTVAQVMTSKKWPTLGRYLQSTPGQPLSPHQAFLKTLTYGYWREYSEYSHATYQGLIQIAMAYLQADLEHEHRPKVEEATLSLIFNHMSRVAAILLCILTELQAYFRFDGARINERLDSIWRVLIAAPEVRELYDSRYAELFDRLPAAM